jgi:hypothetical protein
MSKIIGLTFLAILAGTSLIAWSHPTASVSREAQHMNAMRALSLDEMHTTAAVRALHEQKINDMSVVFSDER